MHRELCRVRAYLKEPDHMIDVVKVPLGLF